MVCPTCARTRRFSRHYRYSIRSSSRENMKTNWTDRVCFALPIGCSRIDTEIDHCLFRSRCFAYVGYQRCAAVTRQQAANTKLKQHNLNSDTSMFICVGSQLRGPPAGVSARINHRVLSPSRLRPYPLVLRTITPLPLRYATQQGD